MSENFSLTKMATGYRVYDESSTLYLGRMFNDGRTWVASAPDGSEVARVGTRNAAADALAAHHAAKTVA